MLNRKTILWTKSWKRKAEGRGRNEGRKLEKENVVSCCREGKKGLEKHLQTTMVLVPFIDLVRASQVMLVIRKPPTKQETQEMWVWDLGWEDPLEEEMTAHSSILAWKISWTEEPGGLHSMRLQRVRHGWVAECTHTHTHTHTDLVKSCFTQYRNLGRGGTFFHSERCKNIIMQAYLV